LVYATLPTINTIDDVNLRDLVRIGYADSLHYIYITGIAIAAVSRFLLAAFAWKGLYNLPGRTLGYCLVKGNTDGHTNR